ncbi:hypothetical protein NA56DRAFT_650279, partial [Hyaloscypha hepaticicola]
MSSTTATTAAPAAAPAGPPLPPPPPALPALPAQPTRTMAALALLPPRRRAVLRAGRTTNPARPSNLEAELGQIVGQARPAAAAPAAPAAPASPTPPAPPTTRRRLRLRHRTTSSSHPLHGVAIRRRIVDQVAPGNAINRLHRPRHRHTPAERARRLAELYRELAALYKEEAEVLEERI